MPRLVAASISITSTAFPARISVQDSQMPQGSATGLSDERQFNAAARMRATVVFPMRRLFMLGTAKADSRSLREDRRPRLSLEQSSTGCASDPSRGRGGERAGPVCDLSRWRWRNSPRHTRKIKKLVHGGKRGGRAPICVAIGKRGNVEALFN